MPTGSFDFDPTGYSLPLGRPAHVFHVYRYDPDAPDGQRYTLLPNVAPESVHYREGPEPGSANMRYRFGDPLGDPDDPQRIEQVYPLGATGERVILNDDRIAFRRQRADGDYELVFDGYPVIPQASLSDQMERVSIQLIGTPIREWDTPIGGPWYRDAADISGGKDVEAVGQPTRFNPDGHANANQADFEVDFDGSGDFKYPTFLDEEVCKSRGIGRKWTLGMAVRYLLMTYNPNGTYVNYNQFSTTDSPTLLDDSLSALRPASESQPINYADSTTYTYDPIFVHDIDVTGKSWPEAIWAIISPHGFGMVFRLREDDNGEPDWYIEFYRKDTITSIKSLLLQPAGSTLDVSKSNTAGLRLQRDAAGLANVWYADTGPVIYEASFILEAAFTPDITDLASRVDGDGKPLPSIWDANATDYDPVKYRQYVFDEVGDGHWRNETETFVIGSATSLDKVLGDPVTDPQTNESTPAYAGRRRPGLDTLVTKDADGKREKAELWVSTDYGGVFPGVYDPDEGAKAHWQIVPHGWRLLKDRLGIELTEKDIEKDFNIGKDKSNGAPYPTGMLKVVSCQTDPGTDPDSRNKRFVFRLTCCIEADNDLAVSAGRRTSSPTKFEIKRRADTRDRYKKYIISGYSHMSPIPGHDLIDRDDTDAAKAYVEAKRRIHELPVFGGSATLGRFTTAYRIADRVKDIKGRDISLQASGGTEQSEGKEFPVIVGIDFDIGDGGQGTTLMLSDRRVEMYQATKDVT